MTAAVTCVATILVQAVHIALYPLKLSDDAPSGQSPLRHPATLVTGTSHPLRG